MRYITCLLLTFLVVACSQPKKSHPEDSLSSDTIRYAQGFTVYHFNDYTSVEVRDPWDSTRLLQRYLLVDRDRPVPGNLPKGTIVQVPAQNIVVYTSVHAAIIDQLGETGRIIGVCEPRYMDTPAIQEGLKAGRIADMGEATAPNVEMMIDKGAELVIVSPFQNSGYGPVEKLGIPILEGADYMESLPLGYRMDSFLRDAVWQGKGGRLDLPGDREKLSRPEKADHGRYAPPYRYLRKEVRLFLVYAGGR